MNPETKSSCWPTHDQELLLKSALLDGEIALDSWAEWRNRNPDVNSLDSGSRRLLPLLYQNLSSLEVDDAELGTYKDVYRNSFCDNEVLLHALGSLLTSFHEVGMRTIVLKGAALIALYYEDSGLRPMADCDLLVSFADAPRAMSLLDRLGWKPVYSSPESRMLVAHSTPFMNNSGQQLDLHWHVMWESWHADNDDGFWQRAVPVKINGVETFALSPTDQLIHVCWHGARWDHVPPIRWITDAMMVINHAQAQIDWNELLREARERRLTLPLHACLSYLRKTFDAVVPPEILDKLKVARPSSGELLSYRLATNDLETPSTFEIIRSLSYDLRWFLSSTRIRNWPIASVRFLQHKWNLKHSWHVPFVLPIRGANRLRK